MLHSKHTERQSFLFVGIDPRLYSDEQHLSGCHTKIGTVLWIFLKQQRDALRKAGEAGQLHVKCGGERWLEGPLENQVLPQKRSKARVRQAVAVI
jgi:hypothetical protein